MGEIYDAAAEIREKLTDIEIVLAQTSKILEKIALVMINKYRRERFGLDDTIKSLDELD